MRVAGARHIPETPTELAISGHILGQHVGIRANRDKCIV
jgi:hypothetical protein